MLCQCNSLHLISVPLPFLHKADQAFLFLTLFYFLKPRRASYFKYNNLWIASHDLQLPCDLVYLSELSPQAFPSKLLLRLALCLNLKLPSSLSSYSLFLTCSYTASQGFLYYQSVLCSDKPFHRSSKRSSSLISLHFASLISNNLDCCRSCFRQAYGHRMDVWSWEHKEIVSTCCCSGTWPCASWAIFIYTALTSVFTS